MIQQYPSISNIYIRTLTLTEIILNGLGFLKELGYLCGTDHPICWAVQFGGRGADLWEHKSRWSQHQLPLKQSARSANWPLGDCFFNEFIWTWLPFFRQSSWTATHRPWFTMPEPSKQVTIMAKNSKPHIQRWAIPLLPMFTSSR